MQFSDLLKQLFSLMWCKLNRSNVVGAMTMFVCVVVAEVRLHNV